MIDESFIEKIEELSHPVIQQIMGLSYSDKPLHLIKQPSVDCIKVSTLTTLIDYLKQNRDDLPLSKLTAHVASPTRVDLFDCLDDEYGTRDLYLSATPLLPELAFGQWMGQEGFSIYLLSRFVASEQRDALLQLVGSLADNETRQFVDDGISQHVTVKSGVARLENVTVPNPVLLSPYRTFHEIIQPESAFLFRLRADTGEEPRAALFEADGGAWRNAAVLSIAAYLALTFAELEIDVPVLA